MKNSTKAAMLVMTLACGVASAGPTFTSINNNSGEVSQAQLLAQIYGGTWTRLTGTQSYSNGSMTAFRVADDGMTSPLNVLGGDPVLVEDDLWSGGEMMVTAKAKHASDTHTFGWINGSSGMSGFQPIISTTSFEAPVKVSLTSGFRWALQNHTMNQTLASRDSNNPNDLDMMATYAISGAGVSTPTWLLMWEDRTTNSDRDFNDAVIEIKAVPEPGTIALAALGMMSVRRRRRD